MTRSGVRVIAHVMVSLLTNTVVTRRLTRI